MSFVIVLKFDVDFSRLRIIMSLIIFYPFFFKDTNAQPKFYCVLSPETSEDDINRLDSKVKVEPFDFVSLMLYVKILMSIPAIFTST